ncbi:type II toxin-antitoxin system RelE/ParE family toxin [Pelosinus sp. IPA-1]|uniref:type II toxin-antitoxin system RelE/ParE family toxin n=1 Tax=Pelosinus sp. IPA-1 TaxID=3029569 RepID=UPI00243621DB|nr:type II toxin-antitoxin system RelE/ParE family toxin [Pelosinus sp. IPA-1]GMB02273.1 toxin RelE [Pelosinus sp. IPA-1]
MYEIIFYEDAHGNSPVDELISKLDQKAEKNNKDARIQLKQIMYQIDVLENVGTRCSSEYVKYIRNDIWELRPGDNRILLFGWKNNKIVLLHSFRKTTNETPRRQIERAEREIQDWVSRHGK